MKVKEVLQQESILLMNQIKSDLKQLTGYNVTFVKEAKGNFTLIFTNGKTTFPVSTTLTSAAIPNSVLISIADSVNALTEKEIKNIQIKQA